MESDAVERARGVELIILDVDGVLTDGGLYYGADGEALKRFHVHDGAGIKAVLRAGIRVAVISSRRFEAVDRRMHELGVPDVIQGAEDKLAALKELTERLGIDMQAVACVGDDEADVALMQNVGLAIAVSNARPSVRDSAHLCTTAAGGHGAVREVCDLVLAAR